MFSKETEYALRALVYIQMQNYIGKRPQIEEIAREIEAPQFFTAKILQRLSKQGYVNSLKGKGGGFFFDPEKPEISIKELANATGSNKMLNSCGFGLKNCSETSPCPLHEQYAPIRQALEKLFETQSIQSLAKKYSGNRNIEINRL